MDQEAWNTKRKLWHISGCLSMLPIYFMWRNLDFPVHWLTCVLSLVWLLAGICLAIDIFRLYRPQENQAFKRLPFYGSILRAHEHSGYNASTYCFVAVGILITGLYFGLVSEAVLISAIVVMAVADPVAALARFIFFKIGLVPARFLGLVAFASSAVLLVALVFSFYGSISWLAIITASIATATIEAYTGTIWQYCELLAIKSKLVMPKFIAVVYPDDNFTSPLVFALILLLFGL